MVGLQGPLQHRPTLDTQHSISQTILSHPLLHCARLPIFTGQATSDIAGPKLQLGQHV